MISELDGLKALKRRSNPDYSLLNFTWHSVPLVGFAGFKNDASSKTLRANLSKGQTLRDDRNIILVQPSGAFFFEDVQISTKEGTIVISASSWEDSQIQLEELGETKLAYPRKFRALPQGLLGEDFSERLETIQGKISAQFLGRAEGLKDADLEDALRLEAMVKDLDEDDIEGIQKLLKPENLEKIEKFSGLVEGDGKERVLHRRLLECHMEMPIGHLKHVPTTTIIKLYQNLTDAQKALTAKERDEAKAGLKDDEDAGDSTKEKTSPKAKSRSTSGRRRKST